MQRSTLEDLEEENKYLRQELFLLCGRIQETESWRRSPNIIDAAKSCNKDNEITEEIDNKLSIMETEIVQIRLTNFELLQKMKELERSRLQAIDESKRMQREVQRYIPLVSQVAALKSNIANVQKKLVCLQLAHYASDVYWSKVERRVIERESIYKESIVCQQELLQRFKSLQATAHEERQTIKERETALTEAGQYIAAVQEEMHNYSLERQQLISELNQAQSRCYSLAKELERMQSKTFDIHVITPKDSTPVRETHHQMNTNSPSPLSPQRYPKPQPQQQSDSQPQCGFFCVPL